MYEQLSVQKGVVLELAYFMFDMLIVLILLIHTILFGLIVYIKFIKTPISNFMIIN